MVFKPNWRFERKERDGLKEARKDDKLKRQQRVAVVAAGQQLNGEIMRQARWDQIGDPVDLIERCSSPVRS